MSAITVRPRTPSLWQVVEYQLIQSRQYWKVVLISGLITPLLYILSLGVGLGTVVDSHGHALGVRYVVFVAPAFLTAAALQSAAQEASFPVMGGFKWQRTYFGMNATPLSSAQICDGVLVWIALRTLLSATVYLAIMALLGGTARGLVVLTVPIATLTSLAFSAGVAAVAATLRREGNFFNMLFRFIVTPMFLFSGTFYPISQLPEWGRWLAYVSPLWHGTELSRDAAIGGLSAAAVLGHLLYLTAWLVAGVALARWRFRVRLAE
jgi:lipooligosaccharide transport system permease protein